MTSYSDKWACYQAALSVERPGGGWANGTLTQIGRRYGVGLSTLRRWLSDGFPERGSGRAWRPEHADYVAVATTVDIKAAWRLRREAGACPVSYATFHRALTRDGDRGLLLAALNGHKGLVNNRLYLLGRGLHRNHKWSYDHFEVPAWVTVPRKSQPIKPWATVVSDSCCKALMAVLLIVGKPTAETVAAALAEAAVGRTYDGTWIGGVPVSITYDNAAENEAEGIATGIVRMGSIGLPIDTYSSWQNGLSESKIFRIQRESLAGVPGATLGGKTKDGSWRFVPPDRDDLWPIERLARHLDDFRVHWNTERRQPSGLNGRTPVEAWRADDTEIREIDEGRVVANMMREDRTRVVLAQGVFFRNTYYVPLPQRGDPLDWRGRTVHVRYLARNTEFIAVSPDRHFNDYRFAVNQDALSPAHRAQLLRQRAVTEEESRRVDADALRARLHSNAARGTEYGDTATDEYWAGEAELEDAEPLLPTGVLPPGLQSKPSETGSLTVIDTASTSPARVRRSSQRGPLPAAPPTSAALRRDRAVLHRQAAQAADTVARLGLPLPSTRSHVDTVLAEAPDGIHPLEDS